MKKTIFRFTLAAHYILNHINRNILGKKRERAASLNRGDEIRLDELDAVTRHAIEYAKTRVRQHENNKT